MTTLRTVERPPTRREQCFAMMIFSALMAVVLALIGGLGLWLSGPSQGAVTALTLAVVVLCFEPVFLALAYRK